MLAKIVNRKIVFPHSPFVHNDMVLLGGGSEEILRQYGFKNLTEEELAQAVLDLVHPPISYSKRKLMERLGDKWPECKKILEEHGSIDDFIIEEHIADNDARFSDFLQKVKDILGDQIKTCLC